jgi:hypothetical protein
MRITNDDGTTTNTHDPDRDQPENILTDASGQAHAYILHCIGTENPVNIKAVPLLRLREAIDGYNVQLAKTGGQ